MNNTRKLSLNLLAAFAFGLFGQGCDSNGEDSKASASAQTPGKTATRSVNVKHRSKNPEACETAVQACVDTYETCAFQNKDAKACASDLHDCVFVALGTEACWPDDADKKKKKKKKKKKGCDKKKDDQKKDDGCDDPDFEDDDFEDDDFEDDDFEDSDGDFEDNDDDHELGDEDDIPDFDECEDMNFFALIAKNLGITLKVAACK